MKKTLFAALFLILSVGLFAQQVESGVFEVNVAAKGYTLDKNSGDRIYTEEVRFAKPFETTPSVVCGVNKLDSDKNSNLRVDVTATAISRDGFVLRIKTWGESKLYTVGGSWIAHD
ncbi:MAG: H-type lectin domain-containing protein [Melioribacteraceae bacterium]|nr:H-type lectin domain-containing protein [Melioribacteraceae bacterium]